MNKHFSLFLISFCGIVVSLAAMEAPKPQNSIWEKDTSTFNKSQFFDTSFINNYDAVGNKLCDEKGFTRITFQSTDGLTLHGYLRITDDAPFSMILCSGFYPGRKEGLSTFVEFVPEKTNMLFFDARGHGNSQGRFMTNIHNYGVDEYKDVHGALQCMHKNAPTKPIIVYGICAGAFHAARALTLLSDEQKQQFSIKGFICDSGFSSIVNTADVPLVHLNEKVILSWFHTKGASKEETKKKWGYRLTCFCVSTWMSILRYFVEPSLRTHDSSINLQKSIHNIPCPILFIHSEDDTYAPIVNAQKLADTCSQKECWWIQENSEHAIHHLKHKETYYRRLTAFIQTRLGYY